MAIPAAHPDAGPPVHRADEQLTVPSLYAAYSGHLAAVADTRHGGPDVAHRALKALAFATVIVESLAVERWPLVRRALAAGATVTELSVALGGLEPDEVAAGLGSWGDRQLRAGALSRTEHADVLALVGRIAVSG